MKAVQSPHAGLTREPWGHELVSSDVGTKAEGSRTRRDHERRPERPELGDNGFEQSAIRRSPLPIGYKSQHDRLPQCREPRAPRVLESVGPGRKHGFRQAKRVPAGVLLEIRESFRIRVCACGQSCDGWGNPARIRCARSPSAEREARVSCDRDSARRSGTACLQRDRRARTVQLPPWSSRTRSDAWHIRLKP